MTNETFHLRAAIRQKSLCNCCRFCFFFLLSINIRSPGFKAANQGAWKKWSCLNNLYQSATLRNGFVICLQATQLFTEWSRRYKNNFTCCSKNYSACTFEWRLAIANMRNSFASYLRCWTNFFLFIPILFFQPSNEHLSKSCKVPADVLKSVCLFVVIKRPQPMAAGRWEVTPSVYNLNVRRNLRWK